MMKYSFFAIALILSAVSHATPDVERQLEPVLTGLVSADAKTAAWARSALLQLPKDEALRVLEQREQSAWSAESWRQLSAVAIAKAWLTDPKASQRLYALQGINAAVYPLWRKPVPNVSAELQRMTRFRATVDHPKAPVHHAILLELYFTTAASYEPSLATAFPAGTTAEQIVTWQAQERDALYEGVLAALGTSGLQAAPFALSEALSDSTLPSGFRVTAARALGETQHAIAFAQLRSTSASVGEDTRVRAAATRALGAFRTSQGLDALLGTMQRETDPALVRATLHGLGQLGSAWAWYGKSQAESDAVRSQATVALVEFLKSDWASQRKEPSLAEAAIASLGIVSHPSARLLLRDAIPQASPTARPYLERALKHVDLALSRE